MKINNSIPSPTYNPITPKTTSTKDHSAFSIETAENIKNETDKVSISAAGAEMSDVMDPPVPIGAVPKWWGEFALEVIFLPDGTSAFKNEARFSSLSSGEMDEYFTLLRHHTDELYKRNGLIDDESTYAALNSRSTNERLHQEFLESLRNDPRMAELTGRLGIALS
ncbi:hypothetical protein ACMGT0_12320 [Pseudomonas sp. RHF3.3-3]|uniref:hypothetical protein n=1 Tax=Pseudomonas sp. RHF3.3-3 TaxID=3396624 RepID=UPI003A86FB3C